jgi:hypothetical protein
MQSSNTCHCATKQKQDHYNRGAKSGAKFIRSNAEVYGPGRLPRWHLSDQPPQSPLIPGPPTACLPLPGPTQTINNTSSAFLQSARQCCKCVHATRGIIGKVWKNMESSCSFPTSEGSSFCKGAKHVGTLQVAV